MIVPSMADAPFHCPPDLVLDLPVPPSVNRIWRANRAGPKKVSLSPEYKAWKDHADRLTMTTAQFRGLKTIVGPFEVKIIIQRQRGDLDNRAKGILDWLQSRGVVVDDKYCERLVMEWGEAPTGCRVFVRPMPLAVIGDVLRRAEARA